MMSSTRSVACLIPKTGSPAASELGAIKPEAFQAVDAATVKVTLDSPIVELPSILATKHGMVVKNGASSDDIRFKPNGTGPFTLKELKLGELKTTFTRNAKLLARRLAQVRLPHRHGDHRADQPRRRAQSGEADVVLVVDPATIGTLQGRSEHHADQGAGRHGGDHGHVHRCQRRSTTSACARR